MGSASARSATRIGARCSGADRFTAASFDSRLDFLGGGRRGGQAWLDCLEQLSLWWVLRSEEVQIVPLDEKPVCVCGELCLAKRGI